MIQQTRGTLQDFLNVTSALLLNLIYSKQYWSIIYHDKHVI